MGRDWLGEEDADDWMEPEERYVGVIEAEFKARKAEAQALVSDLAQTDVVPAVMPDIELPVDPKKQSELLMDSWNRLEPRKQVYLKTLKECGFNVRKTIRMLENTPDAVSRTTVNFRWSQDDNFAFVLKVITATAVGDVIKKERLLLRADEIADEALEPKPILHKGLPTGFYENQPDTALRANEQLMKATGLLRDAQQSTRVTVRLVNLAGPEHDVIEGEAEVVG